MEESRKNSKRKFKQVLWGFKYPNGTILIGHSGIPIVNRKRKETLRQCNGTPNNKILKPRPVRLIMEER